MVQSDALTPNTEGGTEMPNSIFDTYGTVDVRSIEIDHLHRAYAEALKNGDVVRCALIARNLRSWGVAA